MKIQSRIAKAAVAGALGMLFLALLVLNLSSGERKIDHRIPHLYSVGDALFVRLAAQVLKSSSTEGSESARMMYLLSIAAASQSILLSNSYFVPDDLSVRMLTAQKASRSRSGELLHAGVQVYEYQPTMSHVKVMIVDGAWAPVGSTNFDNHSFRLNDEANLNVLDSAFAARLVRTFEEDKAHSRRVTLADWRARPWTEKLLEHAVGLLRSQF